MSNEQRIYDRCIVRVGQLEAENAELREQQAEWRRVAESKQDIIDHMRDANAENAKLRELVADMLPFISEETGFCTADCYMCDECCYVTSDSECPVVERIHERAYDLGIARCSHE